MKKSVLLKFVVVAAVLAVSALAMAQEGAEAAATSVPRTVIYQAINLAGLLILLFVLLRKKVAAFFSQRHDSVAQALKEANRIRVEAENKHQEYVVKIQELEREADSILAQIRKDGEESKLRMIEEAKRLSEQIKEEAKRSAENEIERARSDLYNEVLEKALEGARTLLDKSVVENDQRRLQKEFVEKIEAVQ